MSQAKGAVSGCGDSGRHMLLPVLKVRGGEPLRGEFKGHKMPVEPRQGEPPLTQTTVGGPVVPAANG